MAMYTAHHGPLPHGSLATVRGAQIREEGKCDPAVRVHMS